MDRARRNVNSALDLPYVTEAHGVRRERSERGSGGEAPRKARRRRGVWGEAPDLKKKE